MTTLFDTMPRDDVGPARYGESAFPYCNRTARRDFNHIRTQLESWFSRYPLQFRADLRARFRSVNDVQHDAAFFELVLHELLSRLGYALENHPVIPGTSNRPEFLATSADGTSLYIEAKVASGCSDREYAARAHLNELYRELHALDSSDYWINIEIDRLPHKRIPLKRFRAFVYDKLSELRQDQILHRPVLSDLCTAPRWNFQYDGWSVTLIPLPKLNVRDKARSALGVQTYGLHRIDPTGPICAAILKKAKHYGQLDRPFLVAINALGDFVDDSHIEDALFGSPALVSRFPGDELHWKRESNGVWNRPLGQYRRVGAVLICRKLHLWNLATANVRLYHHPSSSMPITGAILRLPQAIVESGRLRKLEGESLGKILNIDTG
jgi:hypothetical protein